MSSLSVLTSIYWEILYIPYYNTVRRNIMLKIVRRTFIFMLIAALALVFVGCQSNLTGHQIVGVWEHDGNKIEFTDKGWFKKGSEKYTYSVNEKKVTIDNNGEAMEVEYSINSNGTLIFNGLVYYPVSK